VHYHDTIPWPDVDGNGLYLKLADLALDNSLASSWSASDEVIVSVEDLPGALSLRLYPNPVRDFLHVEAGVEIRLLQITDMQGRSLYSEVINAASCDINLSGLRNGPYLVSIITNGATYTGKIIKE